jgi:hypothetical protein
MDSSRRERSIRPECSSNSPDDVNNEAEQLDALHLCGNAALQRGERGASHGAGDGDRTHDIQLGKLTFYR